ncbi:hypothetical protein [Gilvibacter sp.]|uniref:hypothetical protein n=1 Tax=Gilvibacter sp. TaxID=2729997 RepID=UPI0025C4DB5E|nr:hypothetical protein [Gilvibacter sp.]NQX77437.1 hypothetical protein [Gilvibacter sp.]
MLLLVLVLSSISLLNAQSTNKTVPSITYEGIAVRPFIDRLKQKILSDTIKFNRNDLVHINGRTVNKDPYSMLIVVNMKYSYRFDIVDSALVKSFVQEILQSENILSIDYIEKPYSVHFAGTVADEGLITTKPRIKLNFEVGGLKYFKGRKRKGGNNFLQIRPGEVMTCT